MNCNKMYFYLVLKDIMLNNIERRILSLYLKKSMKIAVGDY